MTLAEHIAELRQEVRGALTRRERNAVATRPMRGKRTMALSLLSQRSSARAPGGRACRSAATRSGSLFDWYRTAPTTCASERAGAIHASAV